MSELKSTTRIRASDPKIIEALYTPLLKKADFGNITPFPEFFKRFTDSSVRLSPKLWDEFSGFLGNYKTNPVYFEVNNFGYHEVTKITHFDGSRLSEHEATNLVADFFINVVRYPNNYPKSSMLIDRHSDRSSTPYQRYFPDMIASLALTDSLNFKEWLLKNIGSQSNAFNTNYDPRDDSETITFDTLGLHPKQLLITLSKLFPETTISIQYTTNELIRHCGYYSLKNGKVLSEENETTNPDLNWLDFSYYLLYGTAYDDYHTSNLT